MDSDEHRDDAASASAPPSAAVGQVAGSPAAANGDGDVADAAGSGRREVPYRWVAMGVVLFGTFMVVLDTTVVNLALESLQEDFDARGSVEWVVTAYLAAVGVAQSASGWLADRFGRKASFVGAMTVFTVASALCAASVSLEMLIASRVLQGIGGGLLMPVGMAMIYELFEPDERGRAMGYFGIAVMAAPALGPVLGGGVVSAVGWHWLFLINVPIGIVGIPLAMRLLRDIGHRERTPFDLTGLLLVGTGLSLLLIGLERGGSAGWTSPLVLSSATVGLVLIALFIRHVSRSSTPLMELRIYANPVFAVAMSTIALMAIAQYARLVYIPLELGAVHDISEFYIGLVMMPQALGMAMILPFGGRLADRLGARVPCTIGVGILAATFVGLASITMDTPLWLVALWLFAGGLGSGLSVMAPNIVAMNSVPYRQISQASGLTNISRQMAAAIGTAIMASIFAASASTSSTDPEALPADVAHDPYRTVFLVGAALLVVAVAVIQFLPGRHKALALQQERRDEQRDAGDTGDARHVAATLH